jgi:predicted RNA-binding protein YlxR (DUF448 family)
MAKKDIEIVSGFLSTQTKQEDESKKEQESEEKRKEIKEKKCLKGFYITAENEMRLKKLKLNFLTQNIKKDESKMINEAIEEYYKKYNESQ